MSAACCLRVLEQCPFTRPRPAAGQGLAFFIMHALLEAGCSYTEQGAPTWQVHQGPMQGTHIGARTCTGLAAYISPNTLHNFRLQHSGGLLTKKGGHSRAAYPCLKIARPQTQQECMPAKCGQGRALLQRYRGRTEAPARGPKSPALGHPSMRLASRSGALLLTALASLETGAVRVADYGARLCGAATRSCAA